MSFLQPLLLAAFPLVGLPILIHLINQRRYQTIRWAAMMFLLAANRMSRGHARLKQWLILLFRMLAIAALVFAVSRPLASGWLGLSAGRRPDTTILLIDRSPSMVQRGTGTAQSKLDTALDQLAAALSLMGSNRWVVIDSATLVARELDSLASLRDVAQLEPADTSADLPAMLEAASRYVRDNRTGRTEIWICSDVRQHDWNVESSRWQKVRDGFLEFRQSIRFHLLAYTQPAPGNLALRVTSVRWQPTESGAELYVSVRITRESGDGAPVSVPLLFEIDGARSELTVEFTGSEFDLKEHRIPVEKSQEPGWGRVTLPVDMNPADNAFYFVFDQPPPRRTVLVSEDMAAVRMLQIAAAVSPELAADTTAELVPPGQAATISWDDVSLVLWHAPLPEGDDALAIKSFVDRGGFVIFFPPRAPGDTEFMGARWGSWVESDKGLPVESWRSDHDLLANTLSGAALPVGQLEIRRYCRIAGDLTTLANLSLQTPLLARAPSDQGGVYFCATTPSPDASSLAANGVVLYVTIQRAMTQGAMALSDARQFEAGELSADAASNWRPVAGERETISIEYPHHCGVYQDGRRVFAVNRSAGEDIPKVVPEERVAQLFGGLDFLRVNDQPGSHVALIQEIWRLFLVSMIVALIVEAVLCLPKVAARPSSPAFPATASPAAIFESR